MPATWLAERVTWRAREGQGPRRLMHRIKTPGAIRGTSLMATLAIVFALLSPAAGCQRESAEQALRGDIASLQAAIESRDAGEMVAFLAEARSEERRVGKECVRTCRFRWAP